MKTRHVSACAFGFIALSLFTPGARAAMQETDIQAMLREHVEQAKAAPGMVIGIVDETGSKVYSCGQTRATGGTAVDGNTVFEIGSVTKVFTSLLLAHAVERGEMKLEDPITKYLPASVHCPTRNGRQITLLDLSTQTSGLPRLPSNLAPKDTENPYADYTAEQLYSFLSSYSLPRDIGATYEYSNLGVGLLGHILELKYGASYESLVAERICRPLGMADTRITLSPEASARLAPGHDASGRQVKNWDFAALAGCGALRSTANNLLKFVAASSGLVRSDLLPAMQLMQKPRHDAGSATMDIGLAWHIAKRFGTPLIWHNGGTAGYRSFIGMDLQNKRAVVVLANSAHSVDDIGFHLLQPKYPLARPDKPHAHVAIELKPEALEHFVGDYELAPGVLFKIRRSGTHLMAQLGNQLSYEVFPDAENEFFYKVVDAQLSFVAGSDGRIESLILHQNGLNQTASRVSNSSK